MDSMDLKGIAWVGNIYHKFEAMCLEVEEAMSQETAKYVENQVQTVGASMKRFCSDVMQDLLPPSSKDLSRVASADLLLNPYLEFGIHKKPKASIKEEAIDPVRIKGNSKDKSYSNNDVWEDWSTASFDWDISDNDEESCERMAMKVSDEAIECVLREEREAKVCNMSMDTSLAFPLPQRTVPTKSVAKLGKRLGGVSSGNIIRAKRTDACESRGLISQKSLQSTSKTSSCQSIDGDVTVADACESSGLVSQVSLQATSKTSSCQSIDVDVSLTEPSEDSRHVSLSNTGSHVDTHCCPPVRDDVFCPHTGSSEECNPNLEDEQGTTVQMMEPTGHGSESGFKETCILVDRNDYCPDKVKEELKLKEEIRRSYKKKFQNAFYLNKKSSRKQEYKQLAAQYRNVNVEPSLQGDEITLHAPDLSENIKSKKLATHDSIESEWELL